MPCDDVVTFMERLRVAESVSARGLEFTILTAARSSEVRGAIWAEIDLRAKTWTVPAKRMEAGRKDRVSLSPRALAILVEMRETSTGGDLVFPGGRASKPLSAIAFDMALRRHKVDVTTHGFRSAFRDWATERSSFPSKVVEMALAHTIGSKVEAAYRRSDLLEKRRKLMEAWAAFCAKPAGDHVVQLGKASAGAG